MIGLDGLSMSAEGDIAYAAGGSSKVQMTMQLPGTSSTMEMRLVDHVVYVSVPPATPAGTFFVLDAADRDGVFGGAAPEDPMSDLAVVDGGLRQIRFVGSEAVDGEDMEHYRLAVDAQAVLGQQGQEWARGMPRTVRYDVWLDDVADLRRVVTDPRGLPGMYSTDMLLDDWGKKVRVVAPAAKNVVAAPTGIG